MRKGRLFLLVFLSIFAASYLLLAQFVPPRPVSVEATIAWWQPFRLAFRALGAAFFGAGLTLAILNRKKLYSFFPPFWQYRYLLYLLVRRDFLVKYKRSVLGVLWTLLNPLANMIILSIVFSQLFRQSIPFYPAYVLSGQILFSCFSEGTSAPMLSIVANAGLLKKVYVPKYIFPLSSVVTAFINLCFSLMAMLLVMIFLGAPFHWSMLMAPVILIYLMMFSAGIGLALATMFVFFRDVAYIYPVLMNAMTYLSAIFFDVSIVPDKYFPIFAINPMFHFIRIFRMTMLNGQLPGVMDHLLCGGLGIFALLVGMYVFYRKQDNFILYV